MLGEEVESLTGKTLSQHSVGGYTASTTLPVLTSVLDGLSYVPTVVVIGLSLANEGLMSTSTLAQAEQKAFEFNQGMEAIINKTLSYGVPYVLVGSVYPQNNYNSLHWDVLQSTFADSYAVTLAFSVPFAWPISPSPPPLSFATAFFASLFHCKDRTSQTILRYTGSPVTHSWAQAWLWPTF